MWAPDWPPKLAAEQLYLRFLVESLPIGEVGAFEGQLRLASFEGAATYTNCIVREYCRITHGSLRPGSWSRTYGSLEIGITGDVNVRPYTARGQVIALRVGLEGQEIADFERVWMGQVRNIRWDADHWVLEAAELPAALVNRFDSDSTRSLLFHGLTTDELADDWEYGDEPLEVVTGGGFERSSEAGDRYCLLVTPTEGDPFFVLADTRSAGEFTDLTAGADGPGGSMFSTWPTQAEQGDAVQECAYTETHPLHAVLRLLESSGTAGTNGDYDLLPLEWGYNIHNQYIDEQDTEYFAEVCAPTSGSTQWQLVVTEAQEDGLAWLTSWLAPGGFFVCLRQGSLSARGVRSPSVEQNGLWVDAATITDDDLVPGTIYYDTYDPDSPVEYGAIRVIAPPRSLGTGWAETETDIGTRPVRSEAVVQLQADWDDNWGEHLTARLGPWLLRVPERLSVQCAGLRTAHVTLGDFVRVESAHVPAPRSRTDAAARRWLVVGGGPDWFQGLCSWELATHPIDAVEAS